MSDTKSNGTLWETLKSHIGHQVEIAAYGWDDPDLEPANISLEDLDTSSVILDAELYDLVAKEEISEAQDALRKEKRRADRLSHLLESAIAELKEGAEDWFQEEVLDLIGTSRDELKELGLLYY